MDVFFQFCYEIWWVTVTDKVFLDTLQFFPLLFFATDEIASKYSLAAAKKMLETSATKKEEDSEVRKG